MFSKLGISGSLIVTGALASICATAQATNINTSGVVCQNFNASQALDIDYLTNSVRNINAAARPVICSIPRSPVAAGSIPEFFADGHNAPGTCTSCTLTLYHFGGAIAASQSFTNCAPATAVLDWDQFVTFPTEPAGVDTFDYASLLCTLPGSGNGLVYGATAVQ